MSAPKRSLADKFRDLLVQTDSFGRRRFSERDVQHFLPLLFFLFPLPQPLPEVTRQSMAAFLARCGADPRQPDSVMRSVTRYYRQHPVNAELMAEVKKFLLVESALFQDRQQATHLLQGLIQSPNPAFTQPRAGGISVGGGGTSSGKRKIPR